MKIEINFETGHVQITKRNWSIPLSYQRAVERAYRATTVHLRDISESQIENLAEMMREMVRDRVDSQLSQPAPWDAHICSNASVLPDRYGLNRWNPNRGSSDDSVPRQDSWPRSR